MKQRDITLWAKEEILSAIDTRVKELLEDPINGAWALDESTELKKQRNRVAKFLGLERG